MARKLSIFSNSSLLKSLRPVCFLAKILGVFPFKVILDTNSNSNTFSYPILSHNWLSCETGYCCLFILGFGFTSYTYIPFIFYINNLFHTSPLPPPLPPCTTYGTNWTVSDSRTVDFLPDIVFLLGQWLTGIITLVFVHLMGPRFVKLWNRCQAGLTILAKLENRARQQNTSLSLSSKKLYTVEDIYRRVLITTTLFLIGFFLILIAYSLTYTLYFWKHFFVYLEDEVHQYLFIIGFPIIFVQVIGHLLHTVFFCTIARVLERMLYILHLLAAAAGEEQNGLNYVTDFGRYIKLYKLFCSIEDMSRKLGANYGCYLILQVTIIMATILVNLYGLLFHPRITVHDSHALYYFGHSFGLPPIAIVVCSGSLVIWCNLGEAFQRSAKVTMKTICEAALRNLSEDCNYRITAFQLQLTHTKVTLTAAGFFPIHRKLLGQLIALMMTYMIFLLQLRLL